MFLSSTSSLNIHSPTMSITMATESWLLSQPSSLLYTKTKFPIISNYVKPFKLQNPSSSSSFGNSSQDLKIFVGNLTSDINVDKLTALFGQAGTVVHAEVIYTWDKDQRFGCITMSTVEEVEKAVNKFDGYELNGKLLTVSTTDDPRKAQPDLPSRPLAFDSPFSVYVHSLTREIDNAGLEEIFSKYGKVESVEIVCDKVTGRTRGFGFVTMSNETDMKNAIAGLHKKMDMGDRKLMVSELPRNL
ncbi:RNA-binding (RRM/RBD/RNP motifs) family protein [Trifolium repens]|nr:RNA-binding (RRM/RBD/RNP motifs) family protein [Trifolium repens]